ncbi:MAG: glutamate--tRNA ligase, partial [Pseudomonadota bacterium]|nr:glutamate--tRNA ligase [Pseudomonadota bacterium]
IDKLEDALALWKIIQGPVESVIDAGDSVYLETALDCLPDEPWDETSWSQWTTELKQSTGRKGKELFMPLRKALTGQSHGPEMQNLLLLIGPTHVKNRLKG